MNVRDNVVIQFIILVLAVTAGQIVLKMLVGALPDNGVTLPVKHVLAGVR